MQKKFRTVKLHIQGRKKSDGAGVDLIRAFDTQEFPQINPFLQFDEIRSSNPNNATRGFPWHPHSGLSTLWYLFEGHLKYEDTHGNKCTINEGEACVITAGNGVIHQEMPRFETSFWGIHIWLNSPEKKRLDPAVQTHIKEDDIPVYRGNDGLIVKVLAGDFRGYEGPLQLSLLTCIFDIHIPPFGTFTYSFPDDETIFAYILEGEGKIVNSQNAEYKAQQTVLFDESGIVSIRGGDEELRIVLCSGLKTGDPTVWEGPIVAGSQEKLDEIYKQYEEGTFL